MKYRRVQSFQVAETWSYQTHISEEPIYTEYIDLVNGLLIMKRGFCYEPSGPAQYLETQKTTRKGLRGYCVHDAFAELFRKEQLDPAWKSTADDIMHELHLFDKMFRPWAWIVYKTVQATDFYIDPEYQTKIQTAP